MGQCCCFLKKRPPSLLPIAALSWTAETPLSPSQLHEQRVSFWNTQPAYSGQREVWDALKAVVECYTSDPSLAQAILDSANISVPSGDVSIGAYDERGVLYVIPRFCLTDPTNLLSLDEEKNSLDTVSSRLLVPPKVTRPLPVPSDDASRTTMETIRVRLSTGMDLKLTCDPWAPLSDLIPSIQKEILAKEITVPDTERVLQFLFMGKRLTLDQTLKKISGWNSTSSILQVLILDR